MVFLILLPLIFIVGFVRGQVIQLVTDTVDLYPEIPKTINLLANDSYPHGDSLKVVAGTCDMVAVDTVNGTGIITFVENPSGTTWGARPECQSHYTLWDFTLDTIVSGIIVFRIHDKSYDSLYINNINARFNAYGNHFFGVEASHAGFEVPKFSGKTTIFSNALWIGGLGDDSTLFLAAERYRQGPTNLSPWTHADFWAGPVSDSASYTVGFDNQWNYVWNLKKSEIDYHKAHWADAGYIPIHDILTWPGNGNQGFGQALQLAPYFDRNNDGIYNPSDGDYPLIRGDQALFFIFNDDRNFHSETLGNKLKVEVHGMAYEFDMPEDSAFKNTVFLNYKVYNRSNRTYYSTYFGVFTDIDLGYSQDDYIECDVGRGSYFCYNGRPIDGTGQPEAYGAHPPAQGVTILGGPYLDPDGKDNPRVDGAGHQLCNASINGLNFGDGIVDNERYGMSKFLYCNNSLSGVPYYMQDPDYWYEYYNYLRGMWKDSTRMIYGGNGHSGTGAYGPGCNFLFPGESDTLNWGVGCQLPNGPVNWTERTAHNFPGDRRGIASLGPFTFNPGQVEDVDVAFVFARDYAGSDTLYPSVEKLRQMIDIIRHSFITNTLPNGNSFNSIDDSRNSAFLVGIYPNPASTSVTIDLDRSIQETITIRVIDYIGTLIRSYTIKPGTTQYNVDVSGLSEGLYLLNVLTKDQSVTRKLAVVR